MLRSPKECGVSKCDHEAWTIERPGIIKGCRAINYNISDTSLIFVKGTFIFCIISRKLFKKTSMTIFSQCVLYLHDEGAC